MRYYKTDCGYIATTKEMSNLTEVTVEEYNGFMEIINNKPIAPSGYEYTLNDSMEWVLIEAPVVEELATEADYIAALEKLGVYAYA